MNQIDEWISAEFQRLAEVVNDYDENLFLEMVPLDKQHLLTDKSKVFRIVDDRTKSIVLYADSLSRPDEILARLWSMDSKHGNVLQRLDAQNAAVEALNLKKQMDEREAVMDFVQFVGKNTKSRWVHEGHARDDEFRDLGPISKIIT